MMMASYLLPYTAILFCTSWANTHSTYANNRKVCPLQCNCEPGPEQGIKVTCAGSNFTSVPVFPDDTISLKIMEKSMLREIQADAFANMQHLHILHVDSMAPWTVSGNAFSKLRKLETLRMKGTDPLRVSNHTFIDLISLINLHMSFKFVTIPHQLICQVRTVHQLGLEDNKLKNITLDPCFYAMSHLQDLIFKNNPLGYLNGEEFLAIRNISVLQLTLENCALTGLGPHTFRHLKSLTSITLTNTKLKWLPAALFEGMIQLKQLKIGQNHFSYIPCEALDSIPSLVGLTLNQNTMKEVKLCPGFTNWTALTKLDIMDIPIEDMNNDFFQYLNRSSLSSLYLTVKKLTPQTFQPLVYLQHLSLQGGIKNLTYLKNAIQGLAATEIQSIVITTINLNVEMDEDIFQPLKSSNVTSLTMTTCSINGISNNTFSPLSKLENLDLSDNNIRDFPAGSFTNLLGLKHLILSKNLFQTISASIWGLHPSLLSLILDNNNIGTKLQVNSLKGLTKLEILSLRHNNIIHLPRSMFKGTNITVVELSGNTFLATLYNDTFQYALSLSSIKLLNTKIVLSNARNSRSPFMNLKNLATLTWSNLILEWSYAHFGTLFNNLPKLTNLILISSKLGVMPTPLFHGTNNLDTLTLSNNEIASWDTKVFKPISKLTQLILTHNKIASVSKESFSYLPNLRHLDLSDNALACNCELMWFREWIETAFIYLPNIYDKKHYHCESPEKFKGVAFLDFNLPEVDCILFSLIKLSVTFSTILVLVLIAAGMVYRYRFEVHMFMFYVRSRQQRLLDGTQTAEYLYDAFVMYSSLDRRWIIDKLIPALETKRGYRLCIEDRNWMPGRAIVDNIIESIETSRRVILLLSKNFSEDNWCVEMAEMAQSHLLSRPHNALVPILLTDIPTGNMRPGIRSVFATRILLTWPQHEGNNRKQETNEKRFWKTLNSALKRKVKTTSVDISEGDTENNVNQV